MKTGSPYFRVVTNEANDFAEIFLYGYIGQDFWWDDDLKEESLTDLAVVRKIRELEQKYRRINVRINSPGGSVRHGDPIIVALQNSPAEIHGYNDGTAASMAADIWIACPYRHMAVNAKLMIHCTSSIAWGNAQELRDAAEVIDKFDAAAIAMTASATGKTEQEVKAAYYDYKDHWLTRQDCEAAGFLTDNEEYETGMTITSPEKMTFGELVRHFADQGDEHAQGLLQRIRDKVSSFLLVPQRTIQASIPTQTITDMTIDEFRRSLEDGTISNDDVLRIMSDRGVQIYVQPQQPDEGDDIQALRMEIDSLREAIRELGAKPGEGVTIVPAVADTDDVEGVKRQLDASLSRMSKEAESPINPFSFV